MVQVESIEEDIDSLSDLASHYPEKLGHGSEIGESLAGGIDSLSEIFGFEGVDLLSEDISK